MKIAVIVSSPLIGGHEIQLLELCKSIGETTEIDFWVSNKEQIHLIGNELNTSKVNIDNRISFKAGNILLQFWRGLKHSNGLVDNFQTYDVIIISAGTPEASISAFFKLKSLNHKIYFYYPALIQRSIIWGKLGMFYDIILSAFIRQLRNIITINKIQREVFARLTGPDTRIRVVSNRVRVSISPQLSKGGRLLYIGRLDPQKRVDEIIEWSDNDAHPFKELLIFGDGPARDALVAKAQFCTKLKVSFFGWMELQEISNLISSSDLLILNSKFEGDPLIIREMQQAGVSVIARDIRGVRGCTNKSQRFFNQSSFVSRLNEHFNGTLEMQEPDFERLSRTRQNQIDALMQEFEKIIPLQL